MAASHEDDDPAAAQMDDSPTYQVPAFKKEAEEER
jgi:hypothetical protein